MSFQGDVAGIGLGELLQGLARGGRDGVLTLDGEAGLSCLLGLQGAQIYFLAGPAEDTDVWRERCQRAWADRPDPHLEGKRRGAIAHAQRRETLFQMLEAPNLHFRFEPGPLQPSATALARDDGLGSSEPARSDKPLGPGYAVEYLLLEHARIHDESNDSLARDLAPGDVPRALGAANATEDQKLFLGQCDGASTLEEISDRLGWPVRQTRGFIGGYMAAGQIRIADHRELLVAAQRELELDRIGRASSRLARWIDLAPPGPVFLEGEAELLLAEWQAGRLLLALNAMPARSSRSVLRRLDFVSPDRSAALARWRALAQCSRRDQLLAFKCGVLAARPATSAETDEVASELLQIARAMQDKETPWRARAVLRLAATQLFEKLATRVEVGTRLVQVGLAQEAAPIVVEAARELCEAGQPDKAVAPLRALVNADPTQREANGLLIHARSHKTNLRRRRRNALIGLCAALVVGTAAIVQLRSQRIYDDRLAQVTEALDRPESALALLDEFFPNDESPRVGALRLVLAERRAELLERATEQWLAAYRAIEQETEHGDTLLGLRRSLEVAPPPEGAAAPPGDWPTRQDLLGIVANRLESAALALPVEVHATADDQTEEDQVLALLAQVLDLVTVARAHDEAQELETFMFFVQGLRDDLVQRQADRAAQRMALETKQLEEQQDLMLAAARAHAQAGDLKRAVSMYDRLLGLDGSDELRPLLAGEVETVRRHNDALERALDRAQVGDHAGARAELTGICPDLAEHTFPFRVETVPSGARVALRGDSTRFTPLVVRSHFGERISLEFRLEGCETRALDLSDPRDLLVHMYHLPERAWTSGRMVTAAPLPVGDDHVLADRSGRVIRLARDGKVVWSIELDSLAGIARTPLFLPRKPGYLLVLSEEGRAWFVDSTDGSSEGPLDLGRPPVEGPVITRSGVTARFNDGRVALWNEQLDPQIFDDDGMFESKALSDVPPDRQTSNVAVLQRSAAAGTRLRSPWSDWEVTVLDDRYEVARIRGPQGSFSVKRSGEWRLVAWEAPNVLVTDGRLWVSDEAGIRSFRPADGLLATKP